MIMKLINLFYQEYRSKFDKYRSTFNQMTDTQLIVIINCHPNENMSYYSFISIYLLSFNYNRPKLLYLIYRQLERNISED